MSYLIEALGRGLVGDLFGAVRQLLPATGDASIEELTDEVRRDESAQDTQIRLACALMDDPINENICLARDLFEHVVRQDPACESGRIGLACIADRLGQNGAAERHLAEALRHRREDPILMFARAVAQEKLGRHDQAERLYEDTLRVCPALRNARERLAAIQLVKGDLSASARHYGLLSASRPDRIGVRLILASLHLARGCVSEALQAYEDALTAEADNWNTNDDRAAFLEKEGRFEEAIECLRDALEEEPSSADAHVRLGDLFVKTGQDRDALAEYLNAVESHPEFLEANVKTGTHFLRAGRYGEAAEWFTRAVEINDRLLVGYIGLAVAQNEVGNHAVSEETLDLAASIEPNSTLLFSEAARLGLKSGLEDVAALRADMPGNADLESIAQLAVKTTSVSDLLGLLDGLIDSFRRVLTRHPNHARMYYRLGLLLRQRGRTQEANDALEMAVRINPSYPRALIKLGLGMREEGQRAEAMDRFRQALGYEAKTCRLHHKLALMFTQQPHFDIARQHYESGLGEKADRVDVSANLQLALENMGLVATSPLFAVDPETSGQEARLGRGPGGWMR